LKTFWSFLDKKRHRFIFAIIAGLGILAFGQSLSAPFYFDDYSGIVDNFFIKHFNVLHLWDYDPSRFITNLTFNLNYLGAGFNLTIWHSVNLAIHILNSFLAYRLTLLTFQTPALLGRYVKEDQWLVAVVSSLIFLLHPIQTQSVIYLVQRSTLLCGLCYLATIYFYARARTGGEDKFYVAALAVAFLGMFTKPPFMTIPLAIGLYDLCFFGFSKTTDRKRSFIYFLLTLPLLIIPCMAWQAGIFEKDALGALRLGEYPAHVGTYLNSLVTFLRLLILPVNLTLDYDYPVVRGLTEFPTPLSLLAISGLAVAGIKAFRKIPWVTFCIFWFFISLGAHIGFFPLADVIFEHWLYLPCYGFALGAALLLIQVCRKRRLYLLIAGLGLAVFFAGTWQRSFLWADPIAFLKDGVRKAPRKARTWHNLGTAYRQKQRFAEAKQAFEKAIALDPEYLSAQSNLADLYISQEQYEKANPLLKKVLQANPDAVDANFHLGRLHAREGNYEQALFYLNRARYLNPYYPHIRLFLGNVYEEKGDLTAARKEMASALWLDPQNPTLYYNLGNINFKLRNFYEAMINYTEAIRRKPGFTEALNNLGFIYFYFHDYRKAEELYKQAIASAPHLPDAYFHLANVLHQRGQIEQSKSAVSIAIRLYRQQGKDDVADSIEEKLNALTPQPAKK
jgi:protein O-mannosyl-transferase